MSSTPTTPATLLDCVNMLLQGIRVARINSLLQADMNSDAGEALAMIHETNREVQMEGWFFNTTFELQLDPDTEGEIALPANTLSVKAARYVNAPTKLTQRGFKLYDPKGSVRFKIGEPAIVDIVECLAFEELSEAGRMLVTAMAARKFCTPKLPTSSTSQWTEEYVMGARRRLEQEDTAQQDTSLADTSPHFALHKQGKRPRQ